jgi:hypothetical protein
MSSTALLKKFEREVKLVPVPGAAHIHVIQPQPAPAPEPLPMSEADWDKFEADINEAFEKLP